MVVGIESRRARDGCQKFINTSFRCFSCKETLPAGRALHGISFGMERFQITINDWAVFSPSRMKREEWLAWAGGGADGNPEACYKPDLAWVNAMLRRRLSPMGKAALWTAGQMLGEQRPEPIATVFASRHGEVGRTVKLLRDLAVQAPLSPASFSLSVHNAIGGIHSIANKVFSPVTAISAGPDTLCAALLEAYAQLRCSPDKNREVLCVFYDDPLPPPLCGLNQTPSEVQALAFRVGLANAGTGILLDFSLAQLPEGDRQAETQACAHGDRFLRFLLKDDEVALKVIADRRFWQWRKCG